MPFLDLRASFSSNFASLLSVLRYNSSVLFHLKLYLYGLGKRRPSQCIFFDFRLLAPKVTKFLTPFFRPQVSFPLNFESPFSVITHNSYEIFKLKHFMLWTQRAYQSTIFQIFGYSNERSHNSSVHFCTRSQFQGLFKFCIIVQCHGS